MASAEMVREALLEMGVDPAKSFAASERFQTVDAAINWVFGAGENWTPEQDDKPLTVAAHVVRKTTRAFDASDLIDPSSGKLSSNPSTWDQHEEHLVASILGNRATTPTDDVAIAQRDDRERSVRASAPPPSPRRTDDDDSLPRFGPSQKEDNDGSLALVPAATDSASQANKEEADFQRAIQESMMTASMASFHSIGSNSENIPPPMERQPGAPVVYLTITQPTYASNLIQAFAAVPQLREIFGGIGTNENDPPVFSLVQELLAIQDSSTESYALVDKQVEALHRWMDISSFPLPPVTTITDCWLPTLVSTTTAAAGLRSQHIDFQDAIADFYRQADQLLVTRLTSSRENSLFVNFERSLSSPTTIHGGMAGALWMSEAPYQSIAQLADVVFVTLRRTPGVHAPQWELEEEVTLDRYMEHHAMWATQLRAQQAVVQGELRRIKEQIEHLSSFNGNSIPDAIQVLIKNLGGNQAVADDESAGREALKSKLERIVETMSAKVASLKEQAAAKEKIASGSLFETDDPDKNEHKYILRAVLFHDGFTTPGKHLYSYVRSGSDWWRVEDEVTKVDWSAIQKDTTGQFTDGGPYLLLYSRDGPRPRERILLSPTTDGSMSPTLIDANATSTSDGDEPMEVEDGDSWWTAEQAQQVGTSTPQLIDMSVPSDDGQEKRPASPVKAATPTEIDAKNEDNKPKADNDGDLLM